MNHRTKLFGLLMILAIVLSGCTKDQCQVDRTFVQYTPEYMSYTEFRQSVEAQQPRNLETPGKIYVRDNLIFVNEYLKGVHVIDNSNPAAPVNIAFINIPGNVDIAVQGMTLYADSYIDLVTINIADPTNAQEVSREQDVFPYKTWQYGVSLDETQGVVKEWRTEEVTETYFGDCQGSRRNRGWDFGPGAQQQADPLMTTGGANGTVTNGGSGGKANMPSVGIGGSMARFALYQNFLYAVTDEEMLLFDISNANNPAMFTNVNIGWNIETIFPYQDKLFIGSQSGVFIYDNSNPAAPWEIGRFEHVTSCDPVVVEDDFAYVTLRNGTPCFGYTNQLDILDIKDLSNPQLIESHDMFNPHGLGIDSKVVFICDGTDGLKVFDAADPTNLKELAHFGNIQAYDVIPLSDKTTLMMIGADGLFMYDYSDINDIRMLSRIPIGG